MSRQPLRRGNWSVQELERLRLLLPHRGVAQTAALLRRSPESVQRKALDILRVPSRRGAWTESDDWQLRQAWGALDPRVLAPMLGRPTGEVRRRAAELRQRLRTGPWTAEELRMLKRVYGTRRDEDLEVCLLRGRADIAAAAARQCLAKDKRFQASERAASPDGPAPRVGMPRWSAAEVARLQQLYPDNDNLTVARALGRSVTSVANKAFQLGLHKSEATLASIGRVNIASRYGRAAGTAVPPGSRPQVDDGSVSVSARAE